MTNTLSERFLTGFILYLFLNISIEKGKVNGKSPDRYPVKLIIREKTAGLEELYAKDREDKRLFIDIS